MSFDYVKMKVYAVEGKEYPIEMVERGKIIEDFDVRLISGAADEDRVRLFTDLIRSGQFVPPVEVSKLPDGTYRSTDGRTRLAVWDRLGTRKIPVIVTRTGTTNFSVEEVLAAYRANTMGPKPPSTEDTRKTIGLLCSQNITRSEAKQLMRKVLPPKYADQLVAEVYCGDFKRKLTQARLHHLELSRSGVAFPKALEQAAHKFNITPKNLEKNLSKVLGGVDKRGGKKSGNMVSAREHSPIMGNKNRQRSFLDSVVTRLSKYIEDGYPSSDVMETFNFLIDQEQGLADFVKKEKQRLEDYLMSGMKKVARKK